MASHSVGHFVRTHAWVFVLCVAVEAWLKVNAYKEHSYGTIVETPILTLNWGYAENYGASFGILRDSTTLVFVICQLIAVSIISAFIYVAARHDASYMLRLGALLFVTGAVGNYMDRASLGFVVDYWTWQAIYIAPRPLPFNLSDMILIAAFVCVIGDISTHSAKAKAA